MTLSPPTKFTFFLSLLIALLAVAAQFVSPIATYVPVPSFWLAIVAYLALMFGNLVRGV